MTFKMSEQAQTIKIFNLAPELAPELVPGKNYGYYWFILIRKRLAYFLVFLCSGSVLDIFISNVF